MGAGQSEDEKRAATLARGEDGDPVPPQRLLAARKEALRATLCDAALEVAGELGWRRLSVNAIVSRAGVSRARFYRLFADKEECLAEAYRRRVGELLGELPDDGDVAGTHRALSRLAELIETDPRGARGVLAETRLAGGAVSASRKEVSERLSHAVRDACRETAKPRHSPPPIAAPFILAALESAVVESLAGPRPRRFSDRVPALLDLALWAHGSGQPSE